MKEKHIFTAKKESAEQVSAWHYMKNISLKILQTKLYQI